jgi:hypothetical protein
MDTLIIQIKKYIKILFKCKCFFVVFLLITIFITLNFFNSNIIHILPDIRISNNLRQSRKLTSSDNKTHIKNNENNEPDEINFLLDTNLTLIEGMNTNLSEILIYYEFIDNISHTYYGSWKNLSVEKNTFIYNKGNGDIDFYEEGKENFLFNLKQNNCSNLSAYFSLKDGIYEDNYLDGNFTFNFQNVSLPEELDKDSFSIIIPNTSLTYSFGEYFDNSKKITINNTFINISFYKKAKNFHNNISYEFSCTDYAQVSLYILSLSTSNKNEKKFEIYFEAEAHGSFEYPKKILNYSIFLSIFAFIEIISTTKFMILINDSQQMSLNTDIYTIIIHIIWSSIIFYGNFVLALSQNNLLFEYIMPGIIYFCLFSFFLLRILFFSWRARNIDLIYRDSQLFKRKLIQFYLSVYILLIFTMASLKIWYSYFIMTFFLFFGTWLGQIIYSAKKGTKPSMPHSHIFLVTIFKAFVPIYLKCYPNSIFSFKPNYLKAFILDIVLIFEAIILSLQKLLGPKFFLTKKYKQPKFDYYKQENEIDEKTKNQECVICLENIGKISQFEESKENTENTKFNLEKFLEDLIKKYKHRNRNKGPYMITPCHHVFHSKCLEMWLEQKNECPYCRQRIPPLEP